MAGTTILQWNCRSLNANKNALSRLLQNYKVDIALLSETWLKPGKTPPRIKNYNIVHTDRNDGYGGSAILIRKSVPYSEITITHQLQDIIQISCIKTKLLNKECAILSMYTKPKHKLSSIFWNNIINQCNNEILMGGDLNSHHLTWGSASTDKEGENLINAIDLNNLCILNDGSETVCQHPSYKKSAVDISICSLFLFSKTKWNPIPDGCGSNHFPILLEIGHNPSRITVNPKHKWCLQNADWSEYKSTAHNLAKNFEFTDNHNHDYLKFIEIINKTAEKSIPTYHPKTINLHRSKCWWDTDCQEAENNRKKAFQKYLKQKNYENFIECKKMTARARKIYKEKRKTNWTQFLETLNKDTPTHLLWQKIRNIDRGINDHTTNPHPPSEKILEQFLQKLTPPTAVTNYLIEQQEEPETTSLNNTFTYTELLHAIKSSNNTSPGHDEIRYPMLHHLPENMKKILLNIFNRIYDTGETISEWNKYIIIPILKQNKNPLNHESYRPIALSSCILKTYERLIKARLEWWLESQHMIPNSFFGFRKTYSCMDSLSTLCTDIQNSNAENKYLTSVFLDIKGAFDNVIIELLIKKMIKMKIPSNIIKAVKSIIQIRILFIKHGKKIIGPRTATIGLPQGGVLSPLLFVIYIIDLLQCLNPEIKFLSYADDICIYCNSKLFNDTRHYLNICMHIVIAWLKTNGLELCPNKTKILCFTRHRQNLLPTALTLGGIKINIVTEYKYLGMILDPKLTFKGHVKNLIKKCESSINMLRIISKKTWGADLPTSLSFYRHRIRSIIDYGCILYGSASNNTLDLLNKIQTKSLRLCIGAMQSTPIHSLLAECYEMPLNMRRKNLSNKFWLHIYNNKSHILTNKITSLVTKCLTSAYWQRKNTPPLVDSFLDYTSSNINIERSNNTTCFLYPLEFSLSNDITDTDRVVTDNNTFQEYVQNTYPNTYEIYTDGSKDDSGTGFSLYDPLQNISKMYTTPSTLNVFHVEILAIHQATEYILEHQNLKTKTSVTIFTDSLSALCKIGNPGFTNNPIIIYKILENINNIKKNRNLDVKIVWIKGHSNIEGNVIADVNAKTAIGQGISLNVPHFTTEYHTYIKSTNIVQWQNDFCEKSKVKGTDYFSIQNKITKPWFCKTSIPRKYVTAICRMRLNHSLCPAHLFKYKMKDTDKCTCSHENIADLNHLFLSCHIQNKYHQKLFETLLDNNIKLPTNIKDILSTKNQNIYHALYRYMKETNIYV